MFKPGQKLDSSRLVWFELQIAPAEFRLAIIPDQPFLFGSNSSPLNGTTVLMERGGNEAAIEEILGGVANLLRKHQVMNLPMNLSEQTFQDTTLDVPSLHLRFAYSDNRRWASVYPLNQIPPEVAEFYRDCDQYGVLVVENMQSRREIPGQVALAMVAPPDAIAKIVVTRNGRLVVNKRSMLISQLDEVLQQIKQKNGIVWYYREDPEQDPTPEAWVMAQAVMEKVTNLSLPIKLMASPEE